MSTPAQDIVIAKGSTFSQVLRYETTPFVYKLITAITKAAPVSITAAAHGAPDGWRVAVISAGGMREVNAKNTPPRATDFHKATVTDPNTITLNDVNSSDFTDYTSGGYVMYYTPVSLAGYTARMQIRPTAEDTATPLASLVSPTDIVLDDTLKTITVSISATATAAYTFTTGVYDLELVSGAGVVTKLLSGSVSVLPEVTK